MEKKKSATEQIANESAYDHSNGNRYKGDNSKQQAEGGAEKGGPDLEKAKAHQPPEADRAGKEL